LLQSKRVFMFRCEQNVYLIAIIHVVHEVVLKKIILPS
jgi:hypothetical protein